jgi:glycosyltransferase involved in cell wall biosynthesis
VFLSVIVPTRDRARCLERALHSILLQDIDPDAFELIVVDNGSTDDTRDVCLSFAPLFRRFEYLEEHEPGLHAGRHAGWRRAQGDILVFADDDIRADPAWLGAILDGFARPHVGLVGGRIIPDFECEPPPWVESLWARTPWGKTIYQYSVLDFGDAITEISPAYVYGCNFSIRRALLEQLGGFHPDAMPKELLRFRGDGESAVSCGITRLGYVALYHPRALVHHFVSRARMTGEYIYRRAYAQGISDSYAAVRKDRGVRLSRRTLATLRRLAGYRRFALADPYGIRRQHHRGYWDGYTYHQAEIRRDPDLLAWVLRPDYLDTVNGRTHPA